MPDIDLTITVPEVNQLAVLAAFNRIVGAHLSLEGEKQVNGISWHSRWDFNITPKEEDETAQQFSERILCQLGLAVLHMVDMADDEDRYRAAVAAIDPPASDVPDDILT